MSGFRCSVCGANLNAAERNTYVTCEYCGNRGYVSVYDSDAVGILKEEAGRLFRQCDFSTAIDRYKKLISLSPDEAELHWFLALSEYGVEFIEEGLKERTITCRRTQYASFLDNENYLNAVELADPVTRQAYEKEAMVIDELQRMILELSENEQAYDVFISYKETDSITKRRTKESEAAEDLYYALQMKGYRVFYAPVTLREKSAGLEYEPYIFSALNTARVMLVVGFCEENLSAVWVRNEWSRYLDRLRTSRRLHAMLYYNSQTLPVDEIPSELAHSCSLFDMRQGMSYSDITRHIEDLLAVRKNPEKEDSEDSVDLDLLRKLAEDEDYDMLLIMCDEFLDIEPENPDLYLYMTMAELKIPSIEAIGKHIGSLLEECKHFRKAVRFTAEGSQKREELKELLANHLEALASDGYQQLSPEIADDALVNHLYVSNISLQLAHEVFKLIRNEENVYERIRDLYLLFVDDSQEEQPQFSTRPIDEVIDYLKTYLCAFGERSDRCLDLIIEVKDRCLEKRLFLMAYDICNYFKTEFNADYIYGQIDDCCRATFEDLQTFDWEDLLSDNYSKEDRDRAAEYLMDVMNMLSFGSFGYGKYIAR